MMILYSQQQQNNVSAPRGRKVEIMTTYEKEAVDFLKKHNAKMTISLVGDSPKSITGGLLYRVRIDREGKSWTFSFSDSIYNKQHGLRPTRYGVLACLIKDDPSDFEDFCLDFCYNSDSIKALKTWKACRKEYKNVMRIFGDCIEELAEIE